MYCVYHYSCAIFCTIFVIIILSLFSVCVWGGGGGGGHPLPTFHIKLTLSLHVSLLFY